jgi:oligopeptide/dipeptide ABC transporter ATP-binding protein
MTANLSHPPQDPVDSPLLAIEDLTVNARIDGYGYPAVEGLTLSVQRGRIHGLVGESGSGKSLTLRAIIGLLPENVHVGSGAIRFKGEDLLADGGLLQRKVRGTGITMVFQEPSVALNPLATVGRQIADGAAQHRGLSRKEAREYALHMMNLVGIPSPEKRVDAYPFQFSGGMRQRVMIAAAVACEPDLILCDEPTTALDVTVQEQILSLFAHLRDELNAGLLYVTHDLAVVGQLCDDVSVMYAGRVVESGSVADVLERPQHAYTQALLDATPEIEGTGQRLASIPGMTPALDERPAGYDFAMRLAQHRRDDERVDAERDAHG